VYCQQCGMQLTESTRFCSRCGAPLVPPAEPAQPSGTVVSSPAPSPAPVFVAPPVIPPVNPVGGLRGRVQTLAVLWLIYSSLRLVYWAAGLPFRSGFFRMSTYMWPRGMSGVYPMLGGMFLFSRILSLATAVVGLWAGVALMRRHAEGRTVAIIAACLALLSFPLGTALGIYTLIVLLRAGAAESYDRLSVT
jgi:hypothetical protein